MDSLGFAWICTLIACLCFGSTYVPAKMTDIKDGQFFGLWLTVGIFLVGLVQWSADGMYAFEPIAMLGGVIWAAGNLFVPFIIQRCGLGVGQLTWGSANMLTGWATGAFGLFGVNKAEIANPALNYTGVGLAVVALLLFTQMGQKNDESLPGQKVTSPDENSMLIGEQNLKMDLETHAATSPAKTANSGFTMGLIVALFAGVLFGSNFDPPTVLQQIGQKDAEQGLTPRYPVEATAYVFSHFTGILAFTCATFLAFKLTAKECHMGSNVIVPGLVAGVLWGIAQVCWFNANSVLSFVVAFPIIVGVPCIIAVILGIVLFGENRDPRSLKLLAAITVVQAASLACITVSHGS